MAAEARLSNIRHLRQISLIVSGLIGLAVGLVTPAIYQSFGAENRLVDRYFAQPIILGQISVLTAVLFYSLMVASRLGRTLGPGHGDRQLVAEVEGLTDPIAYAVWVLPVSGFVGTVIGVSSAIAPLDGLLNASGGVDKGAIDKVLAGLNVAFDTTLFGLISVIPAMAVSMAMGRMTERRVARLLPSFS